MSTLFFKSHLVDGGQFHWLMNTDLHFLRSVSSSIVDVINFSCSKGTVMAVSTPSETNTVAFNNYVCVYKAPTLPLIYNERDRVSMETRCSYSDKFMIFHAIPSISALESLVYRQTAMGEVCFITLSAWYMKFFHLRHLLTCCQFGLSQYKTFYQPQS